MVLPPAKVFYFLNCYLPIFEFFYDSSNSQKDLPLIQTQENRLVTRTNSIRQRYRSGNHFAINFIDFIQQPTVRILLYHYFFAIWVVLVYLYLRVNLDFTILVKLLKHDVADLLHHHRSNLNAYIIKAAHRSFLHFD
jgi:hypothetical protein